MGTDLFGRNVVETKVEQQLQWKACIRNAISLDSHAITSSFPEDTLLREMFVRGRVEKRTLNEAIFKQE